MSAPLYPSRAEAARRGAELAALVADGGYVAPSGARVDLAAALAAARAGTVSYPPERAVPPPTSRADRTTFTVANESTLAAARRLHVAGLRPAALNFASARHPGGGWLSGARAQEESLATASALVTCIERDPMYAHHLAHRDTLYTSWAIYAPDVPVVRGDDGALLEAPWPLAFLTCPAPNAAVVLRRAPGRRAEVEAALAERIDRILAIAAAHGHDALVLGAWGCGVFGNDPAVVAALFAAALDGPHAGRFRQVTFAVLDSSPERRFIGPFEARFAGVSRAGRG